jgi:methylmalonyl-CoA mutase
VSRKTRSTALEIDNDAVRDQQIARLAEIRARRATRPSVVAALKALGEAAHDGTGNLLELRSRRRALRATVGEISRRRWKASGAATRPSNSEHLRRLRRGKAT